MEQIKIGFVGVGYMGQCAHLRNYAAIDECEVVAIAELRPKLGEQVAARYGVGRVYSSHEDLLANEKLDGIVAAQPFQRHGQLVPQLLTAGVPVFIEKPLASTVDAARSIVQAAKDHRTWVMVGYHKRSDPGLMYVKDELDRLRQTGELGSLRYIRITMPPGDFVEGGFDEVIMTDEPVGELATDPPDPQMDEQTFEQYISFVNYYIHQVNLLRWLLGEKYRVVHAEPTGVVLVARSDSGVPGVIEMNPYRTTRSWKESVLIGFERGYIEAEIPAPLARNRSADVRMLRDPGDDAAPQRVRPQSAPVDAMRQQALNFIRAIRGELAPPCDAAEAIEDLATARDYVEMLARADARCAEPEGRL